MLTQAYWMEVETVISYLANSINPDGIQAQEIIKSLNDDIQEELGHVRQFGERIKELLASFRALSSSPPSRAISSRLSIRPTSGT
jgi:hypothetical protein